MRHVVLFAILAAAAGCFPDARCDPDQVLYQNLCLPGSAGDAAPPLDGGGDAGADSGLESLGRGCATIDECGADTNLCAVVPGATSGFCTRSGCLADPSMCPAGWTCFDASAYVAGMSLCIAQ